MSTLSERLTLLIHLVTSEARRNKGLEERTGVPADRWSAFMLGRQRPTAEMIEGFARAYPMHCEWLLTGQVGTTQEAPPSEAFFSPSPEGKDRSVVLKRYGVTKEVNVPHAIELLEYNDLDRAQFEWGYYGRGPKELAANILYAFGLDEETAKQCANQFTKDVVSHLKKEGDVLSEQQIHDWIHEYIPDYKLNRNGNS